MQPLKHAKNLFEVLRIDSQPVVLHRKCPSFAAILGDGDMDFGDSRTLVFDGIADEVLKQLNQLHIVCHDVGQRIVCHQRAFIFNGAAQIYERLFQRFFTGDFD